MIDAPTSILVLAGAALAGCVLLAVAIFSVGGGLKKLHAVMDDMRAVLQMWQEQDAHDAQQRALVDEQALALRQVQQKARVDVRMRGTLKLFEERQEFRVDYLVTAMGTQRVMVDRIKATLVNRRDPELRWTLDAVYNTVLGPGDVHEGEVTVGIKDLAKVNLPYVPEFSFMRESCHLQLLVEYEEADGQKTSVERDVLEW